jgi:hypothetical protein
VSVEAARVWLAARTPAAPAALLEHMDAALIALPSDQAGTDLADTLGRTAVQCLARALSHGADRSGAFDLLAADALLTYGCEAATDGEADDVGRFADAFGARRLGALLG